MAYKILISKIATDKVNKKLGKIVRVDLLPGKTEKSYKLYAIILVKKLFKDDIIIPLDLEKLLKVEGVYAYFDIIKKEFDEEVKRTKNKNAERKRYTGDTGFHKTKGSMGYTYEPYRLSRKGKERKR